MNFDRRCKRYDDQLDNIRQQKELFDKRAEIRTVKRSMRYFKPPTTTKLLMAIIFINCSIVEIYSMWVMWALADLSSLYALITSVITESLSFAVYCAKAYNETKQEELIKLERDKIDQDARDPQDVDDPEGEDVG